MKLLLRTFGIDGLDSFVEIDAHLSPATLYLNRELRRVSSELPEGVDSEQIIEFELVGYADGMPYYRPKEVTG